MKRSSESAIDSQYKISHVLCCEENNIEIYPQ